MVSERTLQNRRRVASYIGAGLIAGGGGGAIRPVQIASRADWPINRALSSGSNYNVATKVAFWNGRTAMTNIRLIYANLYFGSTGAEATDVGAGTVRGSIEVDGSGTRLEATWAGLSGAKSLAAGEYVVSDVIPGLTIDAYAKFYAHTLQTNVSGEYRPVGQYYMAASRSEGYGASGTLATAAAYFTGGSAYPFSDGFNGIGPIGIIGTPVSGSAECVVMLHDSIGYGNNEQPVGGDAKGNRGYIGKGFGDTGRYLWKMGRAGGTIANSRVANSPVRSALFTAYASHLLYQLGENSLAVGTMLTDWEDAVTEWKALRSGIIAVGAKVLCKTASTSGDWTSDGDQTVATGDQYVAVTTTGKPRFNLRIRMDELVTSGLLAGSIDALPYVKSPGTEDKWISTGAADYATNDGLHLSEALHIIAKQAAVDGVNAGLFDV